MKNKLYIICNKANAPDGSNGTFYVQPNVSTIKTY